MSAQGRNGPIPARVYTRPGVPSPALQRSCSSTAAPSSIAAWTSATTFSAAWLTVPATWWSGCPTGSLQSTPSRPPGHDCADVLQWMHDTRPGGLDPQRIAVGGESAGGNRRVALYLCARDNKGPAIAHQSVHYPFTDTSLTSACWDSDLMPGVNREAGEPTVRLYGGDDPDNPLVNVLGADLHGLPRATVITCGHDVLHTDGVRLVEALRAAGVETLHTHYHDMPHGFLMYSRLTKRADESMDQMAREAGKRLGTAGALTA